MIFPASSRFENRSTDLKCHRCNNPSVTKYENKEWCRDCLTIRGQEHSDKARFFAWIALIFFIIAIISAIISHIK